MAVAMVIAMRSTCPRLRVGAVVVSPDQKIVATGYNGAPSGMPHCDEVGCLVGPTGSCLRAVHAEVNALLSAGDRARGATVYVTASPCWSCLAAAVTAGVTRVVYRRKYVSGGVDPTGFFSKVKVEEYHESVRFPDD